ncbi:MAG: hypothetical protein H6621_07410 [Halobacteriovoraceae bacterium]|nr:hypothetical protein [Halobacteriovoraceae bacterium]
MVGDDFDDEEDEDEEEEKSYSLAFVGKDLSTVGFLGFLKDLEKRKITIHSVSGSGIGSLLAGLYAKYKKANLIDWVSFKYFNDIFPVNNKSKAEEFFNRYEDLLEDEFKKLDEEDLKIAFQLPEGSSLYDYLYAEYERAKEEHYKGFYNHKSQQCSQLISLFDKNDQKLCFKVKNSKKVIQSELDYFEINYPVVEVDQKPLVDIIERGRKFSDNILSSILVVRE